MNRIHLYNIYDQYILLDTTSGSVHCVDKMIYDILEKALTSDVEDVVNEFKDQYDPLDIKDAFNEIHTLVEEGLLLAEEVEVPIESFNPNNEIKALCLHVAHDCNLRCKYCFASQGDFQGQRSLMSLETGKRAFDFLIENSGNRYHLEVDFFGGEPLMNFDLVKELVAYGRSLEKENHKKFRFTLTTNGVLLDDKNIPFINAEMDNVVLSLDGRRDINDEMRPTTNHRGSYDLIVPKFKKLIEGRGDKDYYIRGTFTNHNLDFSNDVELYHDLGFKKTSMEPVVTDPAEPYAIREEHLEEILKEYETLGRKYQDIRKKDEDFLFFHYMIDLSGGPCAYKRSTGCGAGSDYIAVTPEGDIYPCHQFVGETEFKMGDIWSGIKDNKLQEDFKSANIYTKEDCQTCWAKYYCSGGCHANAWYNNGTIYEPFKLGCEMEKKRLECAIAIYASEAVEA